jgi:hypothetical protein
VAFLDAWSTFDAALTVKDGSLMLWSLSVLDVGKQHARPLAQMLRRSAELLEEVGLEPQGEENLSRRHGDSPAVVKYRQLMQAALYLRTLGDAELDKEADRLMAALRRAHGAFRAEGGGADGEEGGVSRGASILPQFHADVLEVLHAAGASVGSSTLEDAVNVEVLLYPQPGKGKLPVAMLLDGRGHFFR